ncbi:unnamed protein product [Closterium sp. NIES-54]
MDHCDAAVSGGGGGGGAGAGGGGGGGGGAAAAAAAAAAGDAAGGDAAGGAVAGAADGSDASNDGASAGVFAAASAASAVAAAAAAAAVDAAAFSTVDDDDTDSGSDEDEDSADEDSSLSDVDTICTLVHSDVFVQRQVWFGPPQPPPQPPPKPPSEPPPKAPPKVPPIPPCKPPPIPPCKPPPIPPDPNSPYRAGYVIILCLLYHICYMAEAARKLGLDGSAAAFVPLCRELANDSEPEIRQTLAEQIPQLLRAYAPAGSRARRALMELMDVANLLLLDEAEEVSETVGGAYAQDGQWMDRESDLGREEEGRGVMVSALPLLRFFLLSATSNLILSAGAAQAMADSFSPSSALSSAPSVTPSSASSPAATSVPLPLPLCSLQVQVAMVAYGTEEEATAHAALLMLFCPSAPSSAPSSALSSPPSSPLSRCKWRWRAAMWQ